MKRVLVEVGIVSTTVKYHDEQGKPCIHQAPTDSHQPWKSVIEAIHEIRQTEQIGKPALWYREIPAVHVQLGCYRDRENLSYVIKTELAHHLSEGCSITVYQQGDVACSSKGKRLSRSKHRPSLI